MKRRCLAQVPESLISTYRTVAESDSAGELDEVASGDGVFGQEGNEVVDGVVDTIVSSEKRFDGGEQEHRAVSSAATVQNCVLADNSAAVAVRTHALGPLLREIATASSVDSISALSKAPK